MTVSRPLIPLFVIATIAIGTPAEAGEAEPRKNVALGKSYSLSPRPNYGHCTDPGDQKQLTDGTLTKGYFWTQQSTVGWNRAPYATITVDLGRIEPISGVSLRTAAGCAGVGWPLAIRVLVSDDGKSYRDVGDLVGLDHKVNGPWPEEYGVRQLIASELQTRGRFVQFLVIATPGTAFIFADEVEVFRGPDALLASEPGGTLVRNLQERLIEIKVTASIRYRYERDRIRISEAIDRAGLPQATRRPLQTDLDEAYEGLLADERPKQEVFRTVLPFSDAHEELFRIQSSLWKALGRPGLTVWVPPTWEPLDLCGPPPETSRGEIDVHMMLGEYRAAAVNLANSAGTSKKVQLHVEGFPGEPTPAWLSVAEVPWTDTSAWKPVAAALPKVTPQEGTWSITVLPGLTRQAWLTLHVTNLPAGTHSGTLVFESEGVRPVRIPFRVHLYPFTFPKETTLLIGGWSYTNGNGTYGVTRENRDEFLAHCQDHFVNAPWATRSPLMQFSFDGGGKIHLDTREMDDWLAQWPRAKKYFFFLGLGGLDRATQQSFAGAKIGTPEFDHRIAAWISAWVGHWRSKGISPTRIVILGHDEPRGEADVQSIIAWGKAIRAAAPQVLHWSDPVYRQPAEAPNELFETFDILCPNRPMWLRGGPDFARFYRDQQSHGRTLQFYSCSGPARLLDPYSYYRLQAWHCWKIGATGSFFWALGDNGYASSWNEYLAKHGPYTPLFLDEKTVTAGKQMESIREGVEDFETFVMLRDAVARARKAGRSDAAVSEAESLVDSAADEVLGAEGVEQLALHTAKDRTKADEVRVRMLKAMVALRLQ